jgi:hypothetical protein
VPEMPLIIEPDLDDPDCAETLVDGTVAGRAYRFLLATGAARTQLVADEFTAGLISRAQHRSSGVFAASTNPLVMAPDLAVGPLAATTLAVERVDAAQPGAQNLLGWMSCGTIAAVSGSTAARLRRSTHRPRTREAGTGPAGPE